MLWTHFGENFIDIWGGADFGPYSSQSFGKNFFFKKEKNIPLTKSKLVVPYV
jgi:hypothetical protein